MQGYAARLMIEYDIWLLEKRATGATSESLASSMAMTDLVRMAKSLDPLIKRALLRAVSTVMGVASKGRTRIGWRTRK